MVLSTSERSRVLRNAIFGRHRPLAHCRAATGGQFLRSGGRLPQVSEGPRVHRLAQGDAGSTQIRLGGFSLVELLVVIAILVLVVALTIPAITRSIEAADRNQCGAKQAKLATAMSSYDSRQNAFPGIRNRLAIKSPSGSTPNHTLRHTPGGAVLQSGDFANFPDSNASWFIMILPHVGFQNVFDDVLAGKVWWSNTSDTKTSHDGITQDITVCPARADFYALGWSGKNMHFRANGAGASTSPGAFNRNDGAIGDNANNVFVSLADVVAADGASTTLMITENSQERWFPFLVSAASRVGAGQLVTSASGNFTSFGGDNGGYCVHPDPGGNLIFGFKPTGTITATTPIITPNALESFYPSSAGNAFGNFSAGYHPGGANVAFVDGSWRFLKEDLAPHVYGHLLTHRSVWDGSTYATNSARANVFLQCLPATKPYKLKPEDY